MKERYRIYQRNGGMFYAKDRKTGQRVSLETSDVAEAKRLLAAKNKATEQPCLNVATAKVYLSAQARSFLSRNLGTVDRTGSAGIRGSHRHVLEKVRQECATKNSDQLASLSTEAALFLAVLNHKQAGVSTNVGCASCITGHSI